MTEISHPQAQNLIQTAMSGALTAADKDNLDRHLEGCAACRQYADQMQALGDNLSHLFHARWDSTRGPSVQTAENISKNSRVHLMVNKILKLAGGLAVAGVLTAVILLILSVLPSKNTPLSGGQHPQVQLPAAQIHIETPTLTPSVLETVSATEAAFDPHAYYPLTIAEAKEKMGGVLLTPGYLPEVLSFLGAKYEEETKLIYLWHPYTQPPYPESSDGLLVIEQYAPQGSDCDLCGYIQGNNTQIDQYPIGKLVSEDAVIETIQMDGFSGEYLEGIGWTGTDCCGWQWDDTPYVKRMRFRSGDMAVELILYGNDFTRADMIAIAESMK